MTPAATARCAGITRKRLHQLQDRGQLPFVHPGFRAALDITHAWRLRMQDIAIGGEAGGIGPDQAATLIVNAHGYLAERYGPHPVDVIGLPVAVWLGACEFQGNNMRTDEVERWAAHFAAPIAELPEFIATQLADPASQALRNAHCVKVTAMVNATAAAIHVVTTAEDLGDSND
jgi:hypothetical protein